MDKFEAIKGSLYSAINRNDPLHAHAESRYLINQKLRALSSQSQKLKEVTAGTQLTPAQQEQTVRIQQSLNNQTEALKYQLDLLATPAPSNPTYEHHQITADREKAIQRWTRKPAREQQAA